jgi:TatD DNase family protein
MIDTHCHLSVEDFDHDRDQVVARARQAGVSLVLCPAIDSSTHDSMLAVCQQYPDFCLPMMGLHPTSVNNNPNWQHEIEIIKHHLSNPPASGFYAIGETGLDLHWSRDFLPQQTSAFHQQINLAISFNLPLVLHIRDAWPEALSILSQYSNHLLRGVAHAFSGSLSDYHALRSIGDFSLGIGGPITYKKNIWPHILPHINPSHILLETDAPWLPPTPHRGQRNEPSYLPLILASTASILNIPPSALDSITTSNAQRIFNL